MVSLLSVSRALISLGGLLTCFQFTLPGMTLSYACNKIEPSRRSSKSETEEEKLEVEDFDAEGEREARVFTLWLNSLDVQPAVKP
jgi:hypothetical protein